MKGIKAPWTEELLNLIHTNPDWTNEQLSRALDGMATPKQVAQWKNNNRRKIAEMFGDSPQEDCGAEAVEEAREIVERLAAQSDEEREDYQAEIKLDGMSPKDIVARLESLSRQSECLQRANTKYKVKIDKLEKELAEAEKARGELSECLVDLSGENNERIERMRELENELKQARETSGRLDAENDDRALTLMQALEAKERAEKALTEANESVSEYAEKYDNLVIERDRMYAELEATKVLLEKFRKANEELSARGTGMDEVTELKCFIAEKYLAEWRRG